MTAILPPSPRPFLASRPGERGRVTLLGAPLDRTGSFRPGAGGGPAGIRWASDNLETYSPDLDRDLEDLDLVDAGDCDLAALDQRAALAAIGAATGGLLDGGALPVVLGGEHTVALGVARAVLQRHPDAAVVHLDAHADLRDDYLGERLSHATWARRLGEEAGFDRLLQFGIRSGLREEFALARGSCGHFARDVVLEPAARRLLADRPVHLTLDLDVLDPAYLAGTGTPEAGGCTWRELAAFLATLRGTRIVAIDLCELAPALDPSGASSAVAAKLVRELALAFG
jgi:agmatinase